MPASDQGISPNRYSLIPRTLIFLTRGEKVLLLKGAPHKRLWANRYNGVGGHVERGEDVLSSARRELAEETGLASPGLRLCGTVTVDAGHDIGVGIYVFTGECPEGEAISGKEGVLEWVAVEAIHDLLLVEDLYTLLPRVLSMHPGDPPFSAHYVYDQEEKIVITFTE